MRVVEILLGDDALGKEIARAVQIDFVVGGGGAGLSKIVLGLLNFLRARAVLIFSEPGLGALPCASRLFVHGAEFLVFKADQNLSFFNLVAFFHADPGDAAGDLGIHADFVMRDDVSARRKNGAAGSIAVSAVARATSTSGGVRGKGTVCKGDDAKQRPQWRCRRE